MFKSTIYYKNKNPKDKLDTLAYKEVIIGYENTAYKIYDFSRRKVVISKDIIILKNTFIDNKDKEEILDFNSLPSLNKLPTSYLEKEIIIDNTTLNNKDNEIINKDIS